MTDRDLATLKNRKHNNEAEIPIETLIEARVAGYSCRYIEADLETTSGFTPLIKAPSHAAVMGKYSK